jgi:hypothetical protein
MKNQLEQLKTQLREFIELSKAITPGAWTPIGCSIDVGDGWINCPSLPGGCGQHDATFIARSRNISPAMAECLLVAVDAITDECPHGCLPHCPHHREMEIGIQQILTLWEASK